MPKPGIGSTTGVIVTAPASSANLGPGYDCLALALDLPFHLSVGGRADAAVSGAGRYHEAEPSHPCAVAFREAGGDPSISLWWASPIPPGRGLGFSGAARVAGAYAAGLLDGLEDAEARSGAHRVASVLEGHPDNSAASSYGGFTVAVLDRVLRLDLPEGLAVVVWSPSTSTSTDASRRALASRLPLSDAAFSVARAAAWVAALATGELDVLREACEDRLHQDLRLSARSDAREVRDHLLGRPEVLAAWLSGSGPSIAALVPSEVAPFAASSLPGDGTVRTLQVDGRGVSPA